jgi:4a-hydroxytetrahydrobiopterin dehydratase
MAAATAAGLAKQKCKPCEGGVPPVARSEIKRLLAALPQWQLVVGGQAIRREWRVQDFATAIDFFERIAKIAEAEDHHPDLHLTGYRNVALELSTHAIGGLSMNDFILAAKIDKLPVKLKKQ